MSAGAQTSNERDDLEAKHRAELDVQREEFHRELSRRAFRIGELEQEMIEVAQTYEGSLSWRLTRPVRAARTVLAKLRG
jgi:hypothetical protein